MNEESGGGSTILVVDDNDDVRSLLKFWLEARGYSVAQAANGEAAVETALRVQPGAILMDICMPHLNGFTAALRIRAHEQTRDVPIIAITAHDLDELRGAAIDAGCDELLSKPVDSDELENVLGRLLPERVDAYGTE